MKYKTNNYANNHLGFLLLRIPFLGTTKLIPTLASRASANVELLNSRSALSEYQIRFSFLNVEGVIPFLLKKTLLK